MAKGARIAFELRAGPLAEGDLDVVRVDGVEGLSEPYAFEVEVEPRDGEPFDLEAVLGREAVLTLRRPTGEERVVHGEALRVALSGVAAGRPRYVVTIAPRLARLARVVRSRVFLDRTVPQIADEVLGEHGIARRLDLAASYPARELVVQHREPDLAFVSRLLEAEGIWWRFEHSEGGHELVLADAPGAYADHGAALPLRRESAQGEGVEHVSRLSRTHRLVPGAVALRDFDFVRPGLDLGARAGDRGAAPEVYEWPGGYREPAEGRRLGRTRLDEARHGAETLEGRSNAVGLQPGTAVDVEGEARVLAVRVRHAGEQERATGAAEAVKARYENAFEGLEATRTYRPLRRTPAPRIAGLQTATVVGAAGEEIHTDAHGRVKVLFHWDRDGAREDRSSAWVRVAQAWAGAGMGASFVPRVGQEVVVRFLEGDPDRPLVVGAVYDGANPPPVELPLDKTRSTLRSDSSPGSGGSNELRFEDQTGREELYLHAQRDHAVEVGAESAAEVRGAAALDVAADRAQTILGSHALDVQGSDAKGVGAMQNVAVALGRTTTVAGSQDERVELAQAVNVGGAQHVVVDAASAVFVGAAAALTVGGALVVNVGGALNQAVAGLKSTQVAGEAIALVGGKHEERIAKEREASTAGDATIQVEGRVALATDGDVTEQVQGKVELVAPEGAVLHARASTLEADTLRIVVGGKVALELGKSGPAKVSGANVTVDGGSGPVALKGAKTNKLAAAPPAQAKPQVAPAPKVEPKVVDWTVECAHHAKKEARDVLARGQRIDVVPDVGKTGEKVTIAYRNDAMDVPERLRANGVSVPKAQSKGPKDPHSGRYVLDAEFKGDLSVLHFYKPSFWKAYRQVTTYTIQDGPGAIHVNVHCPRQYRVQLKVPKFRSYKSGDKYSFVKLRDLSDGKLHLASVRDEHEYKETKWSGSKLVEKKEVNKEAKPDSEKSALSKTGCEFKIDGEKVEVGGALLRPLIAFAECWNKISETLAQTPKVGWYIESELSLLQGTVVAEWRWKEHTDHQVFEYIDAYVDVSIVSAKAEFGFGVSGIAFKAQAYASIAGEVTLKLSVCRDHPTLSRSINVPVQGAITGKLGARVEVGHLLKLEAYGKTGIEFRAEFGVNRPDRSGPVSLDLYAEWTGVEVTATASLGEDGVAGVEGGWKKTLAKRQRLGTHRWPDDREYAPPRVSRDRIRQLVLQKLTDGLDAKIATVVRGGILPNQYMSLELAADKLADHIDAHRRFDRSPEAVEGLAAGIRRDLENMARDADERYVLESQFDAYLVAPRGLLGRLDAMCPPSADELPANAI